MGVYISGSIALRIHPLVHTPKDSPQNASTRTAIQAFIALAMERLDGSNI